MTIVTDYRSIKTVLEDCTASMAREIQRGAVCASATQAYADFRQVLTIAERLECFRQAMRRVA